MNAEALGVSTLAADPATARATLDRQDLVCSISTRVGVSVGDDHDTAAFAVNAIRRWWQTMGRDRYAHATRLLVNADAGGSNGYRNRLWKVELARLAAETGLRSRSAITRREPRSGTR